MPDLITEAIDRLESMGQTHLLPHLSGLPPAQRARLAGQLLALDPALVQDLAQRARSARPGPPPGALSPPPTVHLDPSHRAAGEALLAAGQVAAFVVAGGQGTRLGHPGPKGTFPATPVTRKPLFQVFAEQIRAVSRRYGALVPWYILTSPANDAATRACFAAHDHFGLPPDQIEYLTQGTLPSFDPEGQLLLSAPDAVASNPDGHGGSLTALARSGALGRMIERGVQQIAYFQIDNPLACPLDPAFLGAHLAASGSSGEMSSKAVRKTEPGERVGVFAAVEGRTRVVEYSDLDPALAAARRPDGRLVLDAGNIAVHALAVDFVTRLTASGRADLPLHRALKRQRSYDPSAEALREGPVVKFEQFVFDALPRCARSVVVEVERVEEFAPIKNASGADSPATSHRLQVARAARWLEAAGVQIPRDPMGAPACTLEISPLTALESADLTGQELPAALAPGARRAF